MAIFPANRQHAIEAVERYRAGQRIVDIARSMDRDPETVRRWVRGDGQTLLRAGCWAAEEDAILRDARTRGLKMPQIMPQLPSRTRVAIESRQAELRRRDGIAPKPRENNTKGVARVGRGPRLSAASVEELVAASKGRLTFRHCIAYTENGTKCGRALASEHAGVRMCGECRHRSPTRFDTDHRIAR